MANHVKRTQENDWERYFRWYCQELVEYGYLKAFSRESETFTILQDAKHKRVIHNKQKENKIESFNLLPGFNYTYDFRLIWNKKAEYIFYETYFPNEPFIFGRPTFVAHDVTVNDIEETVSYVDVKPHGNARKGGVNSTLFTFPYVQKIIFHLYSLYINKIVPIHSGKGGIKTCLFAKTFVPNRYIYTDVSGAFRKIPYVKRSISAYTKNREIIINTHLNKHLNEKSKLL